MVERSLKVFDVTYSSSVKSKRPIYQEGGIRICTYVCPPSDSTRLDSPQFAIGCYVNYNYFYPYYVKFSAVGWFVGRTDIVGQLFHSYKRRTKFWWAYVSHIKRYPAIQSWGRSGSKTHYKNGLHHIGSFVRNMFINYAMFGLGPSVGRGNTDHGRFLLSAGKGASKNNFKKRKHFGNI